jgi:hypothetical protein
MVTNIKSSAAEALYAPDMASLSTKESVNVATNLYPKYRMEIVWPILIIHAYLNLAGLYGIYLMLTSAKVLTGVWGMYIRCFMCIS